VTDSEFNTTHPWPREFDLFGVGISATSYDQVVSQLVALAKHGGKAIVDFVPVHGLMCSVTDETYRKRVNTFDIVCPDGQPIRWALNYFHGTNLTDRVYGPETTWRLCEAAAQNDIGCYFYGATPQAIEKLTANLREKLPGLRIVGAESPPFRALTPEEDQAAVKRINDSGAEFVFIGIGCPKQGVFGHEHRDRLNGIQLLVGAAFDFHAGTVDQAPPWMQKRGLEWLYRLVKEPKRLWKRYLVTNTHFMWLVIREWVRRHFNSIGRKFSWQTN